jgi:tetratricopeptide (TPR) repeat protein
VEIVGRQGTEGQLPSAASNRRRPAPTRLLWAVALATCLLFPAALANPTPTDLSVEYSGCREVLWPGRRCVVKPGDSLKLWVPGSAREGDPEIRINGRVASSTLRSLGDGRLLAVQLPQGAAWLSLRTQAAQNPRHWFLALKGFAAFPPWASEVSELLTAGRYEEAARLLDRHIPTAGPADLGRALRWRADVTPSIPGDPTKINLLRQAVDARDRGGQILSKYKDAALLAWLLIDRGRFVEARSLLNSLHPPAGSPAKAIYDLTFHRALLAQNTGDFRQALTEFQAAQDIAGRVGLERERWLAGEALAIQESTLGRFQEARDLFESLKQAPPSFLAPYDLGDLLTNYAWSLYRAREAGEGAEDPTANFVAAEQVLSGPACPDPVRRFNAGLNVALAHLQSHRLHEAKVALAAAERYLSTATPSLRFWSQDLQGRIALEEGRRSEALAIYQRLDRLANQASSPEERWRATFGKAAAYDASGDRPAALAALAQAERLVDEQLARIPIQEGRESFVDLWERGSRLYVDLLLRAGQNQEALLVARRARARVLRQLASAQRPNNLNAAQQAARDRALSEYLEQRRRLDQEIEAGSRLAAESSPAQSGDRAARLQALQGLLDKALLEPDSARGHADNPLPPGPGELILAYFPLRQGWIGFAADADGVEVSPFASIPAGATPEKQAEILIQPFRNKIDRARRLRLLPYGKLRTVEFQALPYGPPRSRDILLSARPIVYGLDLGSRETPEVARKRLALIVADARENLPEARAEAREVRSALKAWRPTWDVETLLGRDARRSELLPQLSGEIGIFHYAGHADFSGRGGWESAIPLGLGSRLTLGDVLTLRRAPAWVVLSGCETGRTDEATQVESQGLAHAFLLAGSRAVIAATRRVDDTASRILFGALYRDARPNSDLAVLLQHAQLTLRSRLTGQDWMHFRLYEP